MPDLLDIVESTYQLDLDEAAWMQGLVAAAKPVLDQGLGLFAMLYETSEHGGLTMGTMASLGLADDFFARTGAIMNDLSQHAGISLDQTFRNGVCSTTSEIGGPLYEIVDRHRRADGIRDNLNINASDPTGLGCLLSVNLPRPTTLSDLERQNYARIAAHLASGHRLRRRLTASAGALASETTGAPVEAILRPGGQIEHATPAAQSAEAQATLRQATVAIDRARSRKGGGIDGALEQWKGLVAGRWTLLDQFESGGQRYVVARRNDVQLDGLSMLSERERQVVGYACLGHSNKLIAYDLGLSDSTVRVLLGRAARKLNVRGRQALVRLCAPILTTIPRSPGE